MRHLLKKWQLLQRNFWLLWNKMAPAKPQLSEADAAEVADALLILPQRHQRRLHPAPAQSMQPNRYTIATLTGLKAYMPVAGALTPLPATKQALQLVTPWEAAPLTKTNDIHRKQHTLAVVN